MSEHPTDLQGAKEMLTALGYKWAVEALILCPQCGGRRTYSVSWLIMHLNDDHGWAREDIADWLDTLDPTTVACATSPNGRTEGESA